MHNKNSQRRRQQLLPKHFPTVRIVLTEFRNEEHERAEDMVELDVLLRAPLFHQLVVGVNSAG